MPEVVDVAIIGGGIHGLSAAFHLVSQGVDVQLFERDAAGSGPTARSSAVCRAYYSNEFLARVANESLDFFRHFAEQTGGGDAGYHDSAMVYLHPASDADQVRGATEHLLEIGIDALILDGEELTERCPGFDVADVGIAVWERRAGYADPWSTCQDLYRRAIQLGLRPQLYTEVTQIQTLAGGGAVVSTADGRKTGCKRLLIAAGPWTRDLVRQVGSDLPLTVERHAVATYAWGEAPRVPFGYADTINGFYVRQEGSELFLCGSLHPAQQANPDCFNAGIEYSEVDVLSEKVSRRVPALSAAESRGGWASLYDVSPDWMPVIGQIEDGIFVDAGTSGHGFKLGPGLGRHVAQMILGQADPGLEQFSPARFARHRELAAGYGDSKLLG